MPELVDVATVDALLAEILLSCGTERVALEEAGGRRLRQAVVADRDLPPFNRVMMDGYAIRHSDVSDSGQFKITGTLLAGKPGISNPVEAGSALEVMTGAPLPIGTDTVVPFEDTLPVPNGFQIAADAHPQKGQFVHGKGSDYTAGTPLIPEGRRIRSVEIGTAASCGYSQLTVGLFPSIQIFGTGDELVPVDHKPEAHQIRRSNAQAMAAALSARGIEVTRVDHLKDNPEAEGPRLKQAISESKITIISGAVSKGRLDWIPGCLGTIAECRFHGVAQRPGKPMGVWTTADGHVIFALPGNPVSSLVGCQRYVIPFILRALGETVSPALVSLTAACSFDRPLTLFLPVRRTSSKAVSPQPVNNSGDYAGLIHSDGFVELPSTENHWTAGTEARFYSWS